MGGIALGNGVRSSGLMNTMDGVIHRMLEGRTLYSVVIVLSVIVLVCLLFMFRYPLTVISLTCSVEFVDHLDIYQPHDRQRPSRPNRTTSGERPPGQSRQLAHLPHGFDLLYGDGYAGVWLPEPTRVRLISLSMSFRNSRSHGTRVGLCRAAQEDDLGQVYLTNVDFLKNGIPASFIAALVRVPSRVVSGIIWAMADEGEQVVSTVGYVLMMVIG